MLKTKDLYIPIEFISVVEITRNQRTELNLVLIKYHTIMLCCTVHLGVRSYPRERGQDDPDSRL